MTSIAISKFKARCLAILEQVRRERRPILITRFGKPVAQVIPPPPPGQPKRRLGFMAGTGRIAGDLIAPITDESDWESLGR